MEGSNSGLFAPACGFLRHLADHCGKQDTKLGCWSDAPRLLWPRLYLRSLSCFLDNSTQGSNAQGSCMLTLHHILINSMQVFLDRHKYFEDRSHVSLQVLFVTQWKQM